MIPSAARVQYSTDAGSPIRTVVAERRVGSNVNVVLFAVNRELILREIRMGLNLVHDGYDASGFDDSLDVMNGEVGYTDRLKMCHPLFS